jgi:hypothetical protein
LPAPQYPEIRHSVLEDDDTAGAAAVEQFAAALGVEVTYGVRVTAKRQFSGVEFGVVYVTRERAHDSARRSAYARAATPEQLAAAEVTAADPGRAS